MMIALALIASVTTFATVPQIGVALSASSGTSPEVQLNTLAERSSMFAADGQFLTLLKEEENREPIDLDAVPQTVIDAILAVEDSDFYTHDGLNYRGTFRAFVENVSAGGIEQGGSTITQQLIKNSVLTNEQSLDRKATEAFFALRLERQMTKDEILERYLNTVYFGSGAYGVQAAAETYWNYDEAAQLGWAEAALLAGLVKNPTGFDPTLNPESARERRAVILNRLVTVGHITEEEADQYNAEALPSERQGPPTQPTDYFVREALEAMLNDENILGGEAADRFNMVYRGGLKIYTTFDPKAQAHAEATRAELLPENDDGFTMAMATLDTHNGAVRALIGGPEFQRDQFNLATQGLRQPGSTMKTFVMAALFENGYNADDVVRGDSPCTFDNPGQEPYRVTGASYGVQSIASMIRVSSNCGFVRLGQVVGNEEVIKVSRRLGVTAEMEPFPSLPLGVFEVHPIEMASGYAAMGNDGMFNQPWYIERVEDSEGNVIYEHEQVSTKAIEVQSARQITEVLESNVTSGTGRHQVPQRMNGHPAAGKTGTAQGNEDVWFVGYTDYYATAVWVGHPDLKKRVVLNGRVQQGGRTPAAIWGDFMGKIHEGLEPREFADPEPSGQGSRFLRVEGEIDFCGSRGGSGAPVLVDTDNDGRPDCLRRPEPAEPPEGPETTEPPEPQPEPQPQPEPAPAPPPAQ